MQGLPRAQEPENDCPKSPGAIQRQIEALQAEYDQAQARRQIESQQKEPQSILVQQSPSPKKRPSQKHIDAVPAPKRSLNFANPPVASSSKLTSSESNSDLLTPHVKERPSKFLKALDKGRTVLQSANERRGIQKPTSFTAPATKIAPQPPSRDGSLDPEDEPFGSSGRDDSLRLIENLEPGPKQFKAPQDDPDFDKYEPNSRIRLRPGSRVLSHASLQDYLDARYHLSPSLLYSIIKPGRGNEMEVPVEADYVVIGVLAEKSGIKMTAPKATQPAPPSTNASKKGKAKAPADDGPFPTESKLDQALEGDAVDEQISEEVQDEFDQRSQQRRQKKRFIMFKLLDMRLKRDGLSSAGDSMLNLIMFEADSSRAVYEADSDDEVVDEQTGARMRKDEKHDRRTDQRIYKGGSGGAYERFWKEQNGTVVAILNPRVLKPRHQSGPWAHQSNVLTITPESADSIVVIGRSLDLGTCSALRKDGQPCQAWCDKRVSDACDFHVQNALQKTRSGRSELMIGTSALTRNVGGTGIQRNGGLMRGGRPAPYDPVNKTGLLPRDGRRQVDGVSTYVVKGSGAGSSGQRRGGAPLKPGFAMLSERREKEDIQERKKRREDEEKTLLKVLSRDANKSVGAKYLNRASTSNGRPLPNSAPSATGEGATVAATQDAPQARKRVFDAAALRAIGFDPTRSESLTHLGEDAATKRRRMATVSSLGEHGPSHVPRLGHAPDWKRSNVSAPASSKKTARAPDPSSDDDLVIMP